MPTPHAATEVLNIPHTNPTTEALALEPTTPPCEALTLEPTPVDVTYNLDTPPAADATPTPAPTPKADPKGDKGKPTTLATPN